MTGAEIEQTNVDQLIDCWEHMKLVADQCYAVKTRIAKMLADMTSGDKKTRRIEGTRRKAKVEMPGIAWDQKKLRETWEKFPGLEKRCLKIATIGVDLIEYKKLKETTGGPVLMDYITAVMSADRGPQGTPSISIEE